MSHTTKINVEFRDKDALGAAILALGGQVLGDGSHHLFAGNVTGFGFKLAGWSYPCVLGSDGALSYDDYHGSWGNVKDLDTLKGEYALQVAESVANAQGWIAQRSENSVVIHHPDGGIITVTAAGVDASQFMGSNCVQACASLEQALGSAPERMLKNEYFNRPQEIIIKGE
jgi:hypothetical protein